MALDPERASFLLEPFRMSIAEDAPTKAAYPQWRTLRLDTNLATVAGGDALAADLLATFREATRNFEVAMSGVDIFTLSSFDGSPPTFAPTFSRFQASGGVRLPSEVVIDHAASVTTMILRG